MYDHKLDQESSEKWGGKNKLEKISISKLPEYISQNIGTYSNWLD